MKLLNGLIKMPYKKPCEDCGKKFQPNTSSQKFCNSCAEKRYKRRFKDKNKKLK